MCSECRKIIEKGELGKSASIFVWKMLQQLSSMSSLEVSITLFRVLNEPLKYPLYLNSQSPTKVAFYELIWNSKILSSFLCRTFQVDSAYHIFLPKAFEVKLLLCYLFKQNDDEIHKINWTNWETLWTFPLVECIKTFNEKINAKISNSGEENCWECKILTKGRFLGKEKKRASTYSQLYQHVSQWMGS